MAGEKILVVEDEAPIRELLKYNLTQEGFIVVEADSGEGILKLVRQEKPELILLDLMLPKLGGLDVCRILKREKDTVGIPIVIVSAKGEESDIVVGLELGADDYVTKPFSPKVLVARLRSVLRRHTGVQNTAPEIISAHGITIDLARRSATFVGREEELSFSEFGILTTLMKKPGWVLTRSQIVDEVRGTDYPVTERSVDVHIVSLRKKLGELGRLIETVRGVGYRFAEAE